MNKIALSLLCSSAFFILTLLTINPAFADNLSEGNLVNFTLQLVNTQKIDAPIVSNHKHIKQSVGQFGCSCPSCKSAVRQTLLQGSLPQ